MTHLASMRFDGSSAERPPPKRACLESEGDESWAGDEADMVQGEREPVGCGEGRAVRAVRVVVWAETGGGR
jgi:hypothetical protein